MRTRPIARQRSRALFDLVAGFVYSQWLFACVELRLFERLAQAPLTAEQLGVQSQLPTASAQRLLEAAASLGLTQARGVDGGGRTRYGLGPLGAAMVGNEAVTAMVRHHRALYADLADPLALLRSGRGTGELARYWAYAGGRRRRQAPGALPDASTAPYSALMSATQPLVAGQVLDAYPIAPPPPPARPRRRRGRLRRRGAGARAARCRPTLFDLPAVADAARAALRASRPGRPRAARCGGDFHRDAVPRGADVVSLVRVIYDHDDAPALAILRARAPGAAARRHAAAGRADGRHGRAPSRWAPPTSACTCWRWAAGARAAPLSSTALLLQAGFDRVREVATALPLQAGLLVARAA